ncbi:MAG: type I 3-dehydroquinate dehydratase [Candidatus Altimarinota bacterium]
MKPLITVPIQASSPAQIEKALRSGRKEVAAYEIWLDCLLKQDLSPERVEELVRHWKKVGKKKLVIVCKEKLENGHFTGTQAEKIEILAAAARGGADYIDVGMLGKDETIGTVGKRRKKAKIIVSFHDFNKTPQMPRLLSLAKKMQEWGADIVKIATFVNTLEDNQRLIELALRLKQEKQKHIILGMGEKGMVTRILGQKLGNELQFVSLDVSTAPGQLTLAQAIQFQNVLK